MLYYTATVLTDESGLQQLKLALSKLCSSYMLIRG